MHRRVRVMDLPRIPKILGESPIMRRIRDRIQDAAGVDCAVVITGETGTGKGLVARAIHALSRRSAKPFLKVNCSAVPEQLLESELFGHVAGAFTDARERKGLFQSSEGGTILLDEIGEMPLRLQPKLLHFLEDLRVRPVGSDSEIEVDVRILAATNQDLPSEIANGRFRQDLFYRLKVLALHLPALRDRKEDIIVLARHFTERFARKHGKNVEGLSREAADRLLAHPWPGNARELENCIERAVVSAPGEVIAAEDLAQDLPGETNMKPSRGPGAESLLSLAEMEREYILYVLAEVRGNRTRAAEILCLDRKTLREKLKRYDAMGIPGTQLTGTELALGGVFHPRSGAKHPHRR